MAAPSLLIGRTLIRTTIEDTSTSNPGLTDAQINAFINEEYAMETQEDDLKTIVYTALEFGSQFDEGPPAEYRVAVAGVNGTLLEIVACFNPDGNDEDTVTGQSIEKIELHRMRKLHDGISAGVNATYWAVETYQDFANGVLNDQQFLWIYPKSSAVAPAHTNIAVAVREGIVLLATDADIPRVSDARAFAMYRRAAIRCAAALGRSPQEIALMQGSPGFRSTAVLEPVRRPNEDAE